MMLVQPDPEQLDEEYFEMLEKQIGSDHRQIRDEFDGVWSS